MVIVFSATYTNTLLLTGIHADMPVTYPLLLQLGLVLAAHAYTFIRFNTFAGSIRHSTFYDALKLFLAVGTSYLLLFIVDQMYFGMLHHHVFTLGFLIYGVALTYLCLLLFRLAIKTVYGKFNYNLQVDAGPRAVIYGVDTKSVSLAQSMLTDDHHKFRIIAFISHHKSRSDNSILEKPIITIKKSLAKTMLELQSSILILVTETLTEKEIFQIAEECLKIILKFIRHHWFHSVIITNRSR